MSSTQTFYYQPTDAIGQYAFRDKLNNRFVKFTQRDFDLWSDQGKALIANGYPEKISPTEYLTNNAYTGYFYYEIEFRKRDKKIDFHATQGSA